MSQSLNAQLRTMLVPGAGIIMPGAGNALSARIIEATGHQCLLVSGAAVTNNFLGMPDIGLISCGHFDNQEVVPKDEMVQKIKAAVDARQDPNMMLLARTDSRSVEGLEAAFERAHAYQEAGADMLFIEAPRSVEELAAIPREVPGIHICNMVIGGKTPLLTREELGRMGYAIVAYANAALQASMLGMQQVLQHLNDKGSIVGAEEKIMMFAERQHLLGADFYRDLANQYGTRPQ